MCVEARAVFKLHSVETFLDFRKAREVHPDKQPHAAQSTSSFHKVSAAYEAYRYISFCIPLKVKLALPRAIAIN